MNALGKSKDTSLYESMFNFHAQKGDKFKISTISTGWNSSLLVFYNQQYKLKFDTSVHNKSF